jgi:hypothetical protein
MNQEDKHLFVDAMQKEVADHESRDHWTIVPCSTIPKTAKPIQAIWSFKRKPRPEISMATHQLTRFCQNPKLSHEQATARLGRYLAHTKDRGIVYNPDKSMGIECYVDADFAGGWDAKTSADADNIMSRTVFVITYANCPIYWASRLSNRNSS